MTKEKRLLILLVFLGLALRCNGVAGRSLWTDEFFTLFQSSGHGIDIQVLTERFADDETARPWKAAQLKSFLKNDPAKGFKDVFESVLATDTHPPLYFLLMHGWMRLIKDNALAVRLFSLVMGVCAVLLAYAVSLQLFDRQSALCSALFVSISSFAVRYSQEARSYSFLLVLGLSAWLFLLRLEKNRRVSDGLWFALCNCAGIYTHYFFLFVSAGHFIYFTLIHHDDTPLLRRFYAVFLLSIAFLAPLSIALLTRGYNFYLTQWLFGHPGVLDKLQNVLLGFSRFLVIVDVQHSFLRILFGIAAVLFFSIAARSRKAVAPGHRKKILYCLCILLFPVVSMLIEDFLLHAALLKQERFWNFPYIGIIPLAGVFVQKGLTSQKAATVVLLACSLVASLAVSRLQFGPSPKEASLWIKQEAGADPCAVIVYNQRSVVFAQAYYLDDDVFVVPVTHEEQFKKAPVSLSKAVKRIFIVRHYHPTDPDLINNPFMEQRNEQAGFKFKKEFFKDWIKVSEYAL